MPPDWEQAIQAYRHAQIAFTMDVKPNGTVGLLVYG
jgi:hypothetical protein